MRDSNDFVKLLKTLIKETIDAGEPTNWLYGEVVSATPLKIKIDQKITLEEIQLTLARSVTEWTENIEIDWTTTKHNHNFNGEGSVVESDTKLKGTYQVKHKTALQTGEKVILLQQAGGQHYLVLDRV